MTPIIVGIAGGTGSGKTTVAQELNKTFRKANNDVLVISHDDYYNDQADITLSEREKVNYDHPDSLETDLLVEHLQLLKKGKHVSLPIYDFATHTRARETNIVAPSPIIIVEGILLFTHAKLLSLFDFKVFVDTPDDIRFIRRLKRDVAERGRAVESTIEQYLETVRPMHLQFVEPSKRVADLIISEGGYNTSAMELLVDHVEALLR